MRPLADLEFDPYEFRDIKNGGFAVLFEQASPLLYSTHHLLPKLEAEHQRLGATLCWRLEHALDCVLSCFGPHWALNDASGRHWFGFDSEQNPGCRDEIIAYYADACEGEEIKPEDVVELSRATFDKSLPRWLYPKKLLSTDELKAIARKLPKRAPLIEAALALDDLLKPWRSKAEPGSYARYNDLYHFDRRHLPAYVLYLKPWDLVGGLYDERGNDLMQDSVHHVMNLAMFEPEKPASIRNAMRRMERTFAAAERCFDLLNLLAKPVYRDE